MAAAKRVYYNRVRETTTNPVAVLNVSLTGALTGRVTLGSRADLAVGDVFDYVLEDSTANTWEIGLGTWQGSNSFDRTLVYENSGGTEPSRFAFANAPEFWIDHPAQGVLDSHGSIKAAIDKIVASSANIVAVVPWDLGLDSDAGAWAKQAEWTSWFAELGAIPRVGVWVFTTTAVIGIDLTQGHTPDWATFNNGTANNIIARTGTPAGITVSAGAFFDGTLSIGENGANGSGYYELEFPKDLATHYSANPDTARYNGGIGAANDGAGWTVISSDGIVNSNVNAVALLARSGATIDSVTGLPDLDVYVGTVGGLSTIVPDGSVYDSGTGESAGNKLVTSISALAGVVHVAVSSGNNYTILATDITSDQATWAAVATNTYHGSSIPALPGAAESIVAALPNGALFGDTAGSGIFVLKEDLTTQADGMMANVRTTFNSGWMKGDISFAGLAGSFTADRSPNANTMTEVGTVPSAAVETGADSVEYGPFSAANYGEIPYSADFDYGVGSFYINFWHISTNVSTGVIILERSSDGSGGTTPAFVINTAGSAIRFAVDDGTAGSDQVDTAAVTDNVRHMVTLVKNGTTDIRAYLDGVLANTTALVNATGSMDNASATLTLGARTGGAVPDSVGMLSRIRVGAGSLTQADIDYIYETERRLYQENALGNLAGTSDAVSALSVDPVTGKRDIGTATGATTMQGLNQIAAINNSNTAINNEDIQAIGRINDVLVIGTAAEAVAVKPAKGLE